MIGLNAPGKTKVFIDQRKDGENACLSSSIGLIPTKESKKITTAENLHECLIASVTNALYVTSRPANPQL